MKQSHPLSQGKTQFLLVLLVCVVLLYGCASVSHKQGSDNFQERYKEYQAHVRAGYTAVNKKEYIEAIDQYSKAIEMSPFVASNYYYRGLAWYRKGNLDRAIDDFDKVIVLNSRWHSAYLYRGLCRMKGGEYQGALNDYRRALNLKPNDASIHNNLAWLYATAKDEKFQNKLKALEHAKKAAELTKESNAEILDTLARAYYINGRVKEAIETEKKALEIMSQNEEFKKNLEIYERGGDE